MKVIVRMMRHPSFSVGGAERQMELIGTELSKKNVDFHYISDKLFKYQKKLEIINGIKVHFIGLDKNRLNYRFRSVREIFRSIIYAFDFILFVKYFRMLNSEVYHLRCATNIVGTWAFFAKIIKQKKFIFTLAHIKNCIPGSYQWSSFTNKIYEYGLKRADIVIALAEYMKNALYQNYGVKSVVIKSGHPVPNGPFKKDDPPTILWIARPNDVKRPELFLKIVRELKGINAHFILIAPGEEMKEEFKKLAREYKNFTHIYYVLPGKDIHYYERASLLVNTSIQEGYPNSYIQAWLHETPVIALDVDPDCDICKYGLGFHAKGNFNDLIDRIKELIENPDRLKEIGERCRKYAMKNHDIKKTAEQYYKLYKWVLKK